MKCWCSKPGQPDASNFDLPRLGISTCLFMRVDSGGSLPGLRGGAYFTQTPMPKDKTPHLTPDQLHAHQGASTSEREHQAAVFEWCEAKATEVPELSLIFAVPNGQMRQGMPMEPGMKSGVPDLQLPVPNEDHAGLFIELKRPDGRVREEQQEWIGALREQGYKAEVCYGAEEAIETLESYLGIDE